MKMKTNKIVMYVFAFLLGIIITNILNNIYGWNDVVEGDTGCILG